MNINRLVYIKQYYNKRIQYYNKEYNITIKKKVKITIKNVK